MRSRLVSVLLALVLLLGGSIPARADYTLSNGNVVHWAGGNRIVVTDSRGRTVFSGTGVRQGGHLYAPGTAAGQAGAPSAHTPVGGAILRYGDGRSGAGYGSTGSDIQPFDGGDNNTLAASPYHGTTAVGMQPVVVEDAAVAQQLGVRGMATIEYATVFTDGKGDYYAAIPAASSVGQYLSQHGATARDGWVQLHNAPGVDWVGGNRDSLPTGATGLNISAPCQSCIGGGIITIGVPRNATLRQRVLPESAPRIDSLSVVCPNGEHCTSALFGQVVTLRVALAPGTGLATSAVATLTWTNVSPPLLEAPAGPERVNLDCANSGCSGRWTVDAYPFTTAAPYAQNLVPIGVAIAVGVGGPGGATTASGTLTVNGTVWYPVVVPGYPCNNGVC